VQTEFGSSLPARFTENLHSTIPRFTRPKTELFAVKLNVFWNFLLCEAYEESFGYIFTSYVSKNEAVSCEVQMHFGRFHLARFIKNVLGALSRFMCPKTKLFATKFKRILEVFFVQAL